MNWQKAEERLIVISGTAWIAVSIAFIAVLLLSGMAGAVEIRVKGSEPSPCPYVWCAALA